MRYLIYFLVAITSTTAGGLTGMGGGVVIKPVLDALNDFNAVTIGVLSSFTVFTMAVVSILRHIRQKTHMDWGRLLPLSAGALLGGIAGEKLLVFIAADMANNHVLIVQNILLAIMVACIFMYMLNKHRIRPLGLQGLPATVSAGVFLGVLSSFLGIGGGPANVALLIYLFALNTKAATVASLLTILFSQGAKLLSIALSQGFSSHNLGLLPAMLVGAVIGGHLGALLNKKLSERWVDVSFNAMQLIVLAICLLNILRLM